MENDLVCVQLNGDDVYSEAINEEERERILTDPSYAMHLYQSFMNKAKENVPDVPGSTASENPYLQTLDSESHGNNTQFVFINMIHNYMHLLGIVWNDQMILLLLEEYRRLRDSFRNPKIKKRTLWQQIVAVFTKHNYKVTEEMLDKKFRKLKQTFMRIRDNQNIKRRTGRANIFLVDKTSNVEVKIIESALPKQNIPKHIVKADSQTLTSTIVHEGPGTSGELTPSAKKVKIDFMLSSPTSDGAGPSGVVKDHTERCTTPATTPQSSKRKRKGLLQHRHDLLKLEQQKVTEISLLRQSLDKNNQLMQVLVEIAQERNKLLARLVDLEEKKSKSKCILHLHCILHFITFLENKLCSTSVLKLSVIFLIPWCIQIQ
nr:unnamed protein product [Callosobruchus analis]